MSRRVDFLVGGVDFHALVAAQFMQSEVVYFTEISTGEKIAMAMMYGGFGSVPIVDREKTLVGIVSEFDLLKTLQTSKELDQITAGEIMTPRPISVKEETSVEEIMRILAEKKLIRVPVVDGNGILLGVVSRRDILTGYIKARAEDKPWWM